MSREFRYRVTVDTEDARKAAREVRQIYQRELGKINVGQAVYGGASGGAGRPGPSAGGGFLAGGLGGARKLLAGGLFGYGAMELAQMGRAMGTLGAYNLRTEKTFRDLAESSNLAADVLLDKMRSATQETVTSNRLMASSNMLLVTAQSNQMEITEEQIETLTKFARLRGSQLGVGTEEAYGRLIYGISKRETELLDELGLSTKSMASQLGMSLQEINSDVESFFNAIIQTAEAELRISPEPILDDAAKIEQAEARISEAWDRLKLASVEPVVFTVDVVADVVQAATGDLVQAPQRKRLGEAQRQMIEQQNRLLNQPGGEALYSALGTLGQRSELTTDDEVNRLKQAQETIEELAQSYQLLTALGDAGLIDASTLGRAVEEWNTIVGQIESGTMGVDEAGVAAKTFADELSGISGVFGYVIPQASDFADEMERAAGAAQVANERRMLLIAGKIDEADMTPEERRLTSGGAADSMFSDSGDGPTIQQVLADKRADEAEQAERLAAAQFDYQMTIADTSGQIGLLNNQLSTLTEGTSEWYSVQGQLSRLYQIQAGEAERHQDDLQRKQLQAVEELRSRIMGLGGVPGGGRTPVTSTDMALAEAGLYREKPDEFLRRAESLLVNGDKRTDINRGFIEQAVAASTGFDQGKLGGLRGNLLFSLLEDEFTSGRLFASEFGQANFDQLVNRDAVQQGLGLQNMAESGLNFVMSQLGMGLPGQTDEQETLAGAGAPVQQAVTSGLAEGTGYVAALAKGWQADVDANASMLYPAIDSMMLKVNERIESQLLSGLNLVEATATRVLELISDSL